MDSVLIVFDRGDTPAADRAQELAASLARADYRLTLLERRPAALVRARNWDCVITTSDSAGAQFTGYLLKQRGASWMAEVAPLGPHTMPPFSLLRRFLVRRADMITCNREAGRREIFEWANASPALTQSASGDVPQRQVEALLTRRRADGRGLRILMVGPVNSPHMEHLALSMQQRGHTVQAAGAVWGDGLSPSSLPDAGIPISVMTRPRPLWMRGLINRFQPDVIHANWLLFGALAALSGARPLVTMAWGSDAFLAIGRQKVANRIAIRRSDLLLADSNALRNRLVELNASPVRTEIINWGVDRSSFRPPASHAEQRALRDSLRLGDGPVIFSPRGLKALYNPEVVLEAFARLATALPTAVLVLKHQDDRASFLESFPDKDKVRVVGRVPYERMAEYFRASDVCVSIPSSDSSPRSVWEAMASGAACVLSDLPWVHELIEPGVHALVVVPQVDAVADAIIRLLTEPDLRRSLASHGRALVEDHRDARREMDKLESLYFRLASGRESAITPSSVAASRPASFRRE